jgi:hypothetical protein
MTVNGRRWRKKLSALVAEHLLVDIGTSSLTGVQARALDQPTGATLAAHPIYETLALDAEECAALGSDFQRVGHVYAPPTPDDEDLFVDTYGVTWLWADGYPAQLDHPLEQASWEEIPKYGRPILSSDLQIASKDHAMPIVADAPCPGLLDTCFALRNGWNFLGDVTDNWRNASALLDWSQETIGAAYEHMLTALPEQPDIVVYADDLGFQGGMYLSDTDFRNFLYPRLKSLISRIRRHTDAAICLHSCGGVRTILSDFADLGIEILNLDFYAKGMEIAEVRRGLPKEMILHGPVDLGALGAAASRGERGALAKYAIDMAIAGPSIAAPSDSISDSGSLAECLVGAAVVRTLDPDDIKTLQNIGPEKGVIDKMIAAASEKHSPEISGENPRVVTVSRAHPPSGHAGGAPQPRSVVVNDHKLGASDA